MKKELIFIGLGRMGIAMVERLLDHGYTVHSFDTDRAARQSAAAAGARNYGSLSDAIAAMPGRKLIWLMIPSQFVDDVLKEAQTTLHEGDILIDGGNSFFKDTQRRAQTLADQRLVFVDCGTSGGVGGARQGASLMIGSPLDTYSDIEPLFADLAAPHGYARVGTTGAGHFTKMVHNGIEYGMMGAIAEGVSYLEASEPDLGINLQAALGPYQHGSIISSRLLDWLVAAYEKEGYLASIAGEVPRGETESEMEYIAQTGRTPVLQAALTQRQTTREKPSRVGTLLAAMRNQFGGHKTIDT